MSDALNTPGRTGHVISELGLEVSLVGDDLHGSAEITAELNVPGTDCLRASVLAAWLDVLTGLQCIDGFGGRVPVTLDLGLDLFELPRGLRRVDAKTRTVKVGRSIAVAEVEFRADSDSSIFAAGSASFVASPDVSLSLPPQSENLRALGSQRSKLTQPFAQRAGCERPEPGVASLARRDDGMNASNTINGGLIALTVEEATLSGLAEAAVSSMTLRYLRPARTGPVVARAVRHGDAARVEVRDEGSDRSVVLATTRLFPSLRMSRPG